MLDVVADENPFFVALMVGDLRADPPTVSGDGNEVLRRLVVAQDASSNSTQTHIVDIRSPDRALSRILQVAAAVSRHDAVAIYCIDRPTHAAAIKALNITI